MRQVGGLVASGLLVESLSSESYNECQDDDCLDGCVFHIHISIKPRIQSVGFLAEF